MQGDEVVSFLCKRDVAERDRLVDNRTGIGEEYGALVQKLHAFDSSRSGDPDRHVLGSFPVYAETDKEEPMNCRQRVRQNGLEQSVIGPLRGVSIDYGVVAKEYAVDGEVWRGTSLGAQDRAVGTNRGTRDLREEGAPAVAAQKS
jgi:hypothetical protein